MVAHSSKVLSASDKTYSVGVDESVGMQLVCWDRSSL